MFGDKLIDILLSYWEKMLPFVVIDYYDRGVRLRWGVPSGAVKWRIFRTPTLLEPGFHLKIPFVDEINTHMIKPTAINLPEQTVTTLDEKSIVVKAVIKYEVRDAEKLLLEVDGPVDALSDMIQGIIRTTLIQLEWKDCNNTELANVITKKSRNEARKWGIEILEITLSDLGLIRSIRIIHK